MDVLCCKVLLAIIAMFNQDPIHLPGPIAPPRSDAAFLRFEYILHHPVQHQ